MSRCGAMFGRVARTILPASLKRSLASTTFARRFRGTPVGVMSTGVGAGLRFACGPSNPEYASGVNELPIQEALAAHVAPGSVVYDVGANVGFFTVIAARLAGPGGAVYAFEPGPVNAAFVRRNAALNRLGTITVVERAVSRLSGRSSLWVSSYSGGHALVSAEKPPDAVDLVDVATVSIDDFVFTEHAPPPDVVKVDVEGAELDVLSGMSQVLSRVAPVVLYEVDAADRDGLLQKQDAIDGYLRGYGYSVERIEGAYAIGSWHVSHGLARPPVPPQVPAAADKRRRHR